MLIQSVKRCFNCNPQNGCYIRHYELAHVTIKSFTSALRNSVLGTILSSSGCGGHWAAYIPSVLCLSIIHVTNCLEFLMQCHLHLRVSTGCVCSSDDAPTPVRNWWASLPYAKMSLMTPYLTILRSGHVTTRSQHRCRGQANAHQLARNPRRRIRKVRSTASVAGRQRVRIVCANRGRGPCVPDCLWSFDNESCNVCT
jgi:hypothetical protein